MDFDLIRLIFYNMFTKSIMVFFSLYMEKKRSEVKYLKRKFTSLKLRHTGVLVGSNIRW